MIDFELSEFGKFVSQEAHKIAEEHFRPIARFYDVHEHEYIKETPEIRAAMQQLAIKSIGKLKELGKPTDMMISGMAATEEYNWGDLGIMLGAYSKGLGNAAIGAVANEEQKARWGEKYAAMAITEPGAGSDTAAITTTARLDEKTNEWVLNGEKIFVTGGQQAELVVVWATLDRSLGRAAIKSFVVEKDAPGCTVTKLEHKLGIRASDTAAIFFDECRIPYENVLGDPEIKQRGSKTGFKGAMKTFDVSRPAVAIQAVGVARAALDFTRDLLEKEGCAMDYTLPVGRMTTVQKAILDMEANLEAARLLTWKSVSMLEKGQRNSLESSMAKAKAGRAATLITQKCVEILGAAGYSREHLLEKWMRDCKITDIFEGTNQIQMLVIARLILGFSRDQLK